MIIAYLMKIHKMKYNDAYNYTKKRREIIEPNDGFVKQLKLYQKNGCKVIKKEIKNNTQTSGSADEEAEEAEEAEEETAKETEEVAKDAENTNNDKEEFDDAEDIL
eukprot:182405_1